MRGHDMYIRSFNLICAVVLLTALPAIRGFSAENEVSENEVKAAINSNATETAVDKPATDTGLTDKNGSGASADKPANKSTKKNADFSEGDREKMDAGTQEENNKDKTISVRRFHEVLDELLTEFGYDVKTGQLNGLKNISIRKVSVNSSLPRSYGDYIETLVDERIRENSRVKIIKCLPCKTKRSILSEGKLIVTSPLTNMDELSRAADQLGIDHFMDVMLVYHTTHMVLAFDIFSVSTKELIWARSYNSETLKTRYQKLAVDYSQIVKSRPGEEYVPSYRYMIGLGVASIPNVGGDANDRSMMALNIRGTEKFNNRKSEFGLNLSVMKTTSSFLTSYPTEGTGSGATTSGTAASPTPKTPKPFTTAIMLHAIYAHNFFGNLESYDDIRHGMNLGLGMIVASGYLASSARLGWDIFFGKRFSVSFGGIYVAAAQIMVDKAFEKIKGGGGGDCIFSYNF